MTTYVIWNKADDADFRGRYLAITGEEVQADPINSADGQKYMLGSSRITPEQLAALQNEFTLSTDFEGFTPLEDTR